MKITFLLPGSGHNPVGGFKVVYGYANGLVERGHQVAVLHAPYGLKDDTSLASRARRWMIYAARGLGLKGGFRPSAWFDIDPRVQLLWLPSLDSDWVPEAEVIVATAWETAEWVAQYPTSRGCPYYLIQHQESCFQTAQGDSASRSERNRVMQTWKLPLQKIVIARWLQAIATQMGETATYIPNGLDFEQFGVDVAIAARDPFFVIMLYHDQLWKGSGDGLAAILHVKHEVPQLQATLFGVPPRPHHLPGWIHYAQKPSQALLRQLYNRAAIFVGPSWSEGWGLPGCEAAQCGAALCVTNIGGHQEYAIHEQTALLSPPQDPKALADNIRRLMVDPDLRTRLAANAQAYVKQFTWQRAIDSLEQVIQEAPTRGRANLYPNSELERLA